jgi:hypothetical protein
MFSNRKIFNWHTFLSLPHNVTLFSAILPIHVAQRAKKASCLHGTSGQSDHLRRGALEAYCLAHLGAISSLELSVGETATRSEFGALHV